jgi:short-subunit dehydrogenase
VAVKLEASRVLLTGATGGIGRAIALALHEHGARLVLTGRRADRLDALAAELGGGAEPMPVDLADAGAVQQLGALADVDVLVANAGLPGAGLLTSFTPEEVDRALTVNLRAPMQLALAFLPRMLERGTGHLVFVSSLAGKVASPGGSVYSATKFGLRGFGFALAAELRGTGVGATTVFPGFIREAGMFADSGVRLPRGVGTRTPGDVARAVIEGIERNRAEIDVAPLSLSSGARMFGAAPSLTARLQRLLGGDRVSAGLAEGQSDKR